MVRQVLTQSSGHRARSAASALVRLSIWALIVFHALLFARRIGDATISDPVIALRWLGAAVLVAAGHLHTRRGGSLVADRGALAFWLAAFLLHALALVPGAAPLVDTTTPVWAAALALALVAVSLVARNERTRCRPVRTGHQQPASGVWIAPYLSRPPPISFPA